MRKLLRLTILTAALLILAAGLLWGDWAPGDPYKMHYPQLPDESGWDVNATKPLVLADDWMCTESGYVKDIHFWGSWLGGVEGVIDSFALSIHADIPADQSPTGH
ncbi:MAG: hypothetical protein D6800_02190, partial [Candidatus Zixiibacteriota bacterium]